MIINKLFEDLTSCGKFNCVLFFEDSIDTFRQKCDTISESFKPHQIYMDKFDIDKQIMDDFNYEIAFNDDNSIRRVIFEGQQDQIILEYHQGKFIIEYLCEIHSTLSDISMLLCKLIDEKSHIVIVLGFELSIFVDKFYESIKNILEYNNNIPTFIIEKIENSWNITPHFIDNEKLEKNKKFIIEFINNNFNLIY